MTFKQYLNEKNTNYKEDEWKLMLQGAIPLDNNFYKIKRGNAFRVTSYSNLDKMIKSQGNKTQWSCFTKGSNGLTLGALNRTELLIELEGNYSYIFKDDLNTKTDKNGKKWFLPTRLDKIWEKYSKPILEKSLNFLKIDSFFISDTDENQKLLKIFENFSKKEKQSYIKWYYKEAKKLIKNDLLKLIDDDIITNNEILFTNNEILLSEIKIIKAWFLKENIVSKFLEENQEKEEIYFKMFENSKYKDFNTWIIENDPNKDFSNFLNKIKKQYKISFCDNIIDNDQIKEIDINYDNFISKIFSKISPKYPKCSK
jgi:hypothetical protein